MCIAQLRGIDPTGFDAIEECRDDLRRELPLGVAATIGAPPALVPQQHIELSHQLIRLGVVGRVQTPPNFEAGLAAGIPAKGMPEYDAPAWSARPCLRCRVRIFHAHLRCSALYRSDT
ncbi:hypothetical protein [Nitrobacter sp.]|uniref:hypothetical protein n=1 Tax=Nitrobacter sp. TaxID=29420 RepID=UPI003F64FD53